MSKEVLNEIVVDGSTALIDGVEYEFQPLKLKKALSITKRVIVLISKPELAGDDEVYVIAERICTGLLADGFEVKFDDYFTGKIVLLTKVLFAGMKVNFPDLFETLGKIGGGSLVSDKMKDLGLQAS